MNLYIFVGNDGGNWVDKLGEISLNPYDWGVATERALWQLVADQYMKPRGLDVSAELLENSLLDSPADPMQYGQNSSAVSKIIQSSEFQSVIQNIPNGFYLNYSNPIGIEFRSNYDLFAALQHVDLAYKGCKSGQSYVFEILITDTYDFDWQAIELDKFLATVGANWAYKDQLLGVITPFDVKIEFVDHK